MKKSCSINDFALSLLLLSLLSLRVDFTLLVKQNETRGTTYAGKAPLIKVKPSQARDVMTA